MDEAGAIEEHVDLADLRDQRIDRRFVENVQLVGRNPGFGLKLCQRIGVDVGGMYGCPACWKAIAEARPIP